jgi:hypothetical protein
MRLASNAPLVCSRKGAVNIPGYYHLLSNDAFGQHYATWT